MSQEKYIVAVEICSSKIIGAIGRANPTGRLDVIAVEQEHAVECVCYGIIHNLEGTATRIQRILSKLENRTGVSPRKIKCVYVGLSGRSLRNVPREIFRNLPEDTEITEEILAGLNDEAKRSNIDSSLEVLEAIPATYSVNKSETKNPVGTFGSNIRVNYQLIAARPVLRKHVLRVVRDKVGIPVAGLVITPTAVGNLILSEEERRLGCMLVDMGAETTTVCLYQKGVLQYLAVLPMGGRNITRDICSLSILENDAEEMKKSNGAAINQGTLSNKNFHGVRPSDVAELIAARSEELVANIIEQMNYAGISAKQLPGGIITVGGGFNLRSLDQLLHRQSGLAVRRGSLPANVLLEDTRAPMYECIEVISIMNVGMAPDAPDCMELPQKQELPENEYVPEQEPERNKRAPRREANRSRKPSWVEGFKGRLSRIFSASEDDDADIDE